MHTKGGVPAKHMIWWEVGRQDQCWMLNVRRLEPNRQASTLGKCSGGPQAIDLSLPPNELVYTIPISPHEETRGL
jgi:hypothetical protein